jgi:glycogen debranching enzyme
VEVPQETLNVRRTVLIADRLYYQVRVRSFRPEAVVTSMELVLGADFADVFEVRGVERRTSGRVLAPAHEHGLVRFAYMAGDGEQRETLVQLSPAPSRVEVDGKRAPGSLCSMLSAAGDGAISRRVICSVTWRRCRSPGG